MSARLHPLDASPSELPARMPSPFAVEDIAPIARLAAAQLLAAVDPAWGLDQPGGGKMFGVLVVRSPDGRLGALRAFSGMLAGSWFVDGFVGPAFDYPARESFWPAGEAELGTLDARRQALLDDPAAASERAALAGIQEHYAQLQHAQTLAHAQARAARHAARTRPDADLAALASESRLHTHEKKRLEQERLAAQSLPLLAVLRRERLADELAAQRAARSRELLHAIYDTYVLANARGDRRPLRDIFAPAEPPGGSGDCAAPKLLAHAFAHRLTPLALAELWVGASPATGDRQAGTFYPACRGKCGPILAHMLTGLDVEPAPEYGTAPIAADEPHTLFEDPHLLVVSKPVGLLSVPGRSGRLQDSVQTRLRTRYPEATGPLVVHRLDLDTSGLLLCAKDWDTYKLLQAQFARREITKRYVAWLDGTVPADSGTIDLPLRVDLDDRPRQIVDPVHGKRAITEWKVVRRADNRTLVDLRPLTGRTHQLRVHCAHSLAPIVGDRLYGQPGPRLLLHAAALAFTHPHTRALVELSAPPPFAT